jgi:two-component system sensor histidine kinase ChvG
LKRFTVSATDIASPKVVGDLKKPVAAGASTPADPDAKSRRRPRRRFRHSGSRLGQTIIVLNLLGLVILIGGTLLSSGLRNSLIESRLAGLTLQGHLIANVIDQTATQGEPEPALEADAASGVLSSLLIPKFQRTRLYDAAGRLLADSYMVADRVEATPLPPPRTPNQLGFHIRFGPSPETVRRAARLALAAEVARAATGVEVADLRVDETGRQVVSVSIPIRHVRAVLGVLTLEAGDVEDIIAAERRALIPSIVIAIGVALLSSLALTQLVAVPVLRLARAADRVRLSRARSIALPDLSRRRDEVGDLARSLETMTGALTERMEAIERFAADVAHELRNPMTSIRSAVETLDLVKDAAPRARLLDILKTDVNRMERLVTDISNASRLDAELARDAPTPLDIVRLVGEIVRMYAATGGLGGVGVVFRAPGASGAMLVIGREGPLSQVIRNLIDNARSFSPPGVDVAVSLERAGDHVQIAVEDGGPGMPPDNLETVFERFYTSRPKGAAFGGNSGLGLAIARQIIDAHGGRIWAENVRQAGGAISGARFTVSLPLA